MPTYYLEPSAILKRYRPEPGSAVVNELFSQRTPDEYFVTSYLSALEVQSVALRMRRGGLLRPRRYQRLLAQFASDLAHVRLLPVDDALVDEALQLLPDYPLRTPDALHFSSALRVYRTVGEGFYLISGDRELADAARRYPVNVVDPEEEGALAYLHGLR